MIQAAPNRRSLKAPVSPLLLNKEQVAQRCGIGITKLYRSGLLLRLTPIRLTPTAAEQYDIRELDEAIARLRTGALADDGTQSCPAGARAGRPSWSAPGGASQH